MLVCLIFKHLYFLNIFFCSKRNPKEIYILNHVIYQKDLNYFYLPKERLALVAIDPKVTKVNIIQPHILASVFFYTSVPICELNNVQSKIIHTNTGAPQGCDISPVLFTIKLAASPRRRGITVASRLCLCIFNKIG